MPILSPMPQVAEAGAVAADDLFETKREIDWLLSQIDKRGGQLQDHELKNPDIILLGECAKTLRKLVHLA